MPAQFVVWKEDYGVGSKKLDAQHATILETINRLYMDVQEAHPSEGLREAVTTLNNYTRSHFIDEEDMLRECNYPEYAAHRATHIAFAKQTQDFVDEWRKGTPDLASEMLVYLKDWWLKHILAIDKKYASYLRTETEHGE